MDIRDDDLTQFAATGALPLPTDGDSRLIEHDGAPIWSASYGAGRPVILLHGGMGNSGNFGYQVPALVAAGRQVIVIDSRGQGRSGWDGRPFSYDQMARDAFAVMDDRGVGRAAIAGWSDGACIGLAMAKQAAERVTGVFFFACNVDSTGTKPFEMTPEIDRCLIRHRADYAALSPTPDRFDAVFEAIGTMQRTQPDYSAADLAAIAVPVMVAQAERDEFIKAEHAQYIARTIPRAGHVELGGVSHFAPVQRPDVFNTALLDWLDGNSPD